MALASESFVRKPPLQAQAAMAENLPVTQPWRHETTDLDHRLSYLIKRVTVSMRARMDAALRPLGVTVPQYACLHVLVENPRISGAELARRSFVTRQAVHQVLAELRRRGWIEQEVRGNGSRRGAVRLTQQGRDTAERCASLVDEVEAQMLSALGADEAAILTGILRRCVQVLESSGS